MAELKLVGGETSDKTTPFCHRLFIPIPFVEQVPIPGLNQVQMKPTGDMRFIQCIKSQCANWDSVANSCGDLVQAKSLQHIARMMRDETIRRAQETKISQADE